MKKWLGLLLTAASLVCAAAETAPLKDGLIFVEGGRFLMGSAQGEAHEKPVREVEVRSFYISPYEVTQGLWQKVMKTTIDHKRAEMRPAGRLRGAGWSHPMYYVSWYDAVAFCNRLSEINGLTPCYSGEGEDIRCDFSADGYRLPTEAEWEYAARGGRKSRGFLYAGSSTLDRVAWYEGNSGVTSRPIAGKAPNELGLYDMSGNVYEWCWDRYGLYDEGTLDNPTGAETFAYRVFRGGSWAHGAEYNRAAFRIAYPPERRTNNLGFRMVRRP